ncbi:hypothetical protein D3C74_297160 [compost metagenome]
MINLYLVKIQLISIYRLKVILKSIQGIVAINPILLSRRVGRAEHVTSSVSNGIKFMLFSLYKDKCGSLLNLYFDKNL